MDNIPSGKKRKIENAQQYTKIAPEAKRARSKLE